MAKENKLLDETKELANGSSSGDSSVSCLHRCEDRAHGVQKEVLAAQATIEKHEQTIQEVCRPPYLSLSAPLTMSIAQPRDGRTRIPDRVQNLSRRRAREPSSGSGETARKAPCDAWTRWKSCAQWTFPIGF